VGVLYLIVFVFKERERVQDCKELKENKSFERRETIDQVANYMTIIGLTVYDCCLLGCMLLNVATKGSIASFETLGVAYAESHFLIDPAVAGTIVATCGSVGVLILLSMRYLVEYFTDIQLVCGGLVVMAASIISLTSMQEGAANPRWRYVIAIFMIYSIGYPVGHTVVIALFSKSTFVMVALACFHIYVFSPGCMQLLGNGPRVFYWVGLHPSARWHGLFSPSWQVT
jgi:ceroid-lipofuscinosis MFS transporter 7